MSHSQRCISANRFGDGFDCICDTEPLAVAQAEAARLRRVLSRLATVAQVEREAFFTVSEMATAFAEMRTLLLTADIKPGAER